MKNIKYFKKSGAENTEETIRLGMKRAKDLDIEKIVLASSHGNTAEKALRILPEEFEIITVTISETYKEKGWTMDDETKKKLNKKGVNILTCPHALSGGISEAFGEFTGADKIIAETFYRFSQGMKVCVEISLMAIGAGFINNNEEIISIGGSGDGADTCIVLSPAASRKFKNLEIKEIVTMPR